MTNQCSNDELFPVRFGFLAAVTPAKSLDLFMT